MSKIKVDPSIVSKAVFSECGTYRYWLERTRPIDLIYDGSQGGTVAWLMCNPSKADTTDNDPTVLRCQNRSFKYGLLDRLYRRLIIVNLFGVISTDPKGLGKLTDPIGPENDRYIMQAAQEADLFVCGWGDVGARYKRPGQVLAMLREAGIKLHCLAVNDSGHPQHPLMVGYKTDVKPYEVAA